MNGPKIYLTFDDGPTPDVTPRIIRIFNQFDISATFFIEGRKAARHPEIVTALVENGHSLGYHTFSHARLDSLSWAELETVQRETEKFYQTYSPNSENRLLRPPYGAFSLKTLLFFYLKKTKLIMWTIDSRDSHEIQAEEIISNLDPHKIKPGDIILFHDDSKITAKKLPVIINNLKKNFLLGNLQ